MKVTSKRHVWPARLFGLAALAAAAAAALAFFPTGEPAGAIDLTGEWVVTVEGDVALDCTATVEQAGMDLDAELRCPGAVPTRLKGRVDPQTRAVSLHPRGESGFDVVLRGTASQDGNKVEGDWEANAGRFTGAFHAVRGVEPPGVPDLNGTWTLEVGIDDPVVCPATIQQTGADVQLEFQCEGLEPVTLAGEIDDRLLTFGGDASVTLFVFVSPDGLAFGGTQYGAAAGEIGEALTGLKDLAPGSEGDLTGDWNVTITGGLFGACDVAAQQEGTAIFAAFDCGPAGGWWLHGAIDPATSTFTLSGKAGSLRDYDTRIRGTISNDGESFTASFAMRYQGSNSGGGGTLGGERVDGSPSFLDVAGNYDVLLVSRLGERVLCEIGMEQTQEFVLSDIDCAGVGPGSLAGWISPLTGTFEMSGDVGDVELMLEGTATDGALEGRWTSDRRFVEGCLTTNLDEDCRQPSGRGPGDANCDGRTDSLDAALVLQVSAGFLAVHELPCPFNVSDLRHECCPVVFSALDAAIILQLDAGLFGRLAG